MIIKTKHTDSVTTETYEIEHEGKNYVYTDYFNESGKVIDSILRTEEGYDVDDAALLETIQQYIDEIQEFKQQ